MDDRQLYTTILGLREPWVIEAVEVAAEAEEVRVRLAMRDGTELQCPDCEKTVPGYDQAAERRWRHLDTCQYQTVLVARIPRVECPEHGVRNELGEQAGVGLFTDEVLPVGADKDFPWSNLRQTFFAVVRDTAWAVSTISDSLWSVPLARDTLVATGRRMVIPGRIPPVAPENRPRTPRELDSWAKGFHGAAPPVASDQLLAIPYVQGVLNYGDPSILVLRDEAGQWFALSGAPPIVAASRDQLIAINNPLEDPLQLAVYRLRR